MASRLTPGRWLRQRLDGGLDVLQVQPARRQKPSHVVEVFWLAAYQFARGEQCGLRAADREWAEIAQGLHRKNFWKHDPSWLDDLRIIALDDAGLDAFLHDLDAEVSALDEFANGIINDSDRLAGAA
jgi:hypothetical protein